MKRALSGLVAYVMMFSPFGIFANKDANPIVGKWECTVDLGTQLTEAYDQMAEGMGSYFTTEKEYKITEWYEFDENGNVTEYVDPKAYTETTTAFFDEVVKPGLKAFARDMLGEIEEYVDLTEETAEEEPADADADAEAEFEIDEDFFVEYDIDLDEMIDSMFDEIFASLMSAVGLPTTDEEVEAWDGVYSICKYSFIDEYLVITTTADGVSADTYFDYSFNEDGTVLEMTPVKVVAGELGEIDLDEMFSVTLTLKKVD